MTKPLESKSKPLTPNWLGEALQHARERSGISASALSKLSGRSSSYVTKIENGTINPSTEAFATLAVLLNMTDEEIVWTIKTLGSSSLEV